MHPLQRAQITHLKLNKTSIEVFSEYANLSDIFSSKLTIELPKHTSINNHAIKLIDN